MAQGDGAFTLQVSNIPESNGPIQYEVKLAQNLAQNTSNGFTTIPLDKPVNNVNFGLSGQKEDARLKFIIYDDGTDKSNGTFSSENVDDPNIRFENDTVVTLDEQIIYLREYINNGAVSANWKIFQGTYDSRTSLDAGTEIVIENIDIQQSSDSPTSAQAVVRFKVGERV